MSGANKKKVRKPNNHHERQRRQAVQLVKGFGVAFITGRDKCDIIDLIKNKSFPATMIQARAMTEVAHKWSMFIAALGFDDNGRRYIKSEQIFLTDRRKQADLAETLNEYHQRFVREKMNPRHLVAAAWIGSAECAEISEEQAFNIFSAMGAFDTIKEQAC